MKTKILLLFAWLMATATGCSADESRKDLSDMPPAEKLEEPVAPAGNRKAQIVYFSHTGNTRTPAVRSFVAGRINWLVTGQGILDVLYEFPEKTCLIVVIGIDVHAEFHTAAGD